MNKSKIKALPMVEFSKMEYKRPDVEKYEKDMTALFKEFDEAKTAKECIDVIDKVEQLSVTMNTLSSLVYLHYTINTKDEFYAKEQDFFDDLGPRLGKFGDEYRKRILNCKFRKELVEEFGETLFKMYEMENKTFSPAIMDDLAIENKLVSQYSKLMSIKVRKEIFHKWLLLCKAQTVKKEKKLAKFTIHSLKKMKQSLIEFMMN